jgi:peptidoglycan/LPS O-acetylase OafA/YrhL
MTKFLTNNLLLEFGYGLGLGMLFTSKARELVFTPITGTSAAILALLSIVLLGVTGAGWGAPRGIIYGVPAALVVCAALSLEPQLTAFRRLKVVGDSSYSLYLLHELSLPAIGAVFHLLHLKGAAANTIMLLSMLIGTQTAAVVMYRHAEQPITLWLRRRFL